MNTAAVRSTHPLLIIASIAVTLFSVAGIAALMGWLPSSKGGSAETAVPVASAPAQAPAAAEEHQSPAQRALQAHTKAPATQRTAKAPASGPQAERAPRAEPPAQVAAAEFPPPPPAPPAMAQAPKPVCNNCGIVEAVRSIHKEGTGSGVGAAAGGVLGGVVGHQLGAGRGRDLMTVVGAVGGAIAGNQVEKNRNDSTVYEVTVRYDDGTTQRFTLAQAPTWRNGDRVRVVNGSIQAL